MSTHLRDADGERCWIDHAAAPTTMGEPSSDIDAVAFVRALADDELVRMWWQTHADTAVGLDPPSSAEIRGWAIDALDGPAARLRLFCARAARSGADTGKRGAAPVIPLRELVAPARADHWLEIRVIDEDGAPIAALGVTLIDASGGRRGATTDADGVARWAKLDDGRVRVAFDDDAVYAEVG